MSPTPVAPTGAVVAARTAAPPASPTPSTVLMLQAVRAYPCVSVLVTTTPSERMTSRDAERLRELVADAEDRLRTAGLMRARATVLPALARLLEEAVAGPTSTAVALFCAEAVDRVVLLPLPVRDRVVVDDTFATRDLVRTLHRAPRHLVLVLDDNHAQLLEAAAGVVRPVQDSHSP
jgi:hypothetical protein